MKRVFQLQSGTRNKPISPQLNSLLTAVGTELDVYFEVTSGGQASSGPRRTGSHRHDDGNAADLKAYTVINGQKHYLDQSDPADRSVWSKIIQLSVAGGATGVGAAPDYMGNFTAHIGYGRPAAWGAQGKTANAPRWVREAYEAGRHTPPMSLPGVASELSTNRAPEPRQRPAALTGQTYPVPTPTILGNSARAVGGAGVGGATILTAGLKLPNPTARETQAEQVLARNAGKTAAKVSKSIIPALGRTTEQVARDEQNAILTGYRAVQEGHFPAAPNAPKPASTAAAPKTSSQPSGAQKATTVTVRPNGSSKPVQPAGSVAMPADARPGGATKNVSGSPDDRDAAKPKATTKTVTYEEANPEYAKWLAQYGHGGANASGSPGDRDALSANGGGIGAFASVGSGVASASIPKSPPKTITKTKTYTVADAHAASAARVAAAKAVAGVTASNRAAVLARAQAITAPAAKPASDGGYVGGKDQAIRNTLKVLGFSDGIY